MDTAQKRRQRRYTEPRRAVNVAIPEALLAAIPGEMTAFIIEAIREKLERQRSEGAQ